MLCCFLGQDGDFEDLLPSSSFSTLLDAQGFSDLEKNLSLTPVRGSPSHDPFNTSAPEEVFTDLLFLHVKETLSLKVKVLLTASKTWIHHGCTCVPHPEPPSHLTPFHNLYGNIN